MSDPPDLEKNDLEKPDLEKLARRYLDLWQDQIEGLAADPEVAETIARTIQLMNAGAAQMATMVGPPSGLGRHESGGDMEDHGATAKAQKGKKEPGKKEPGKKEPGGNGGPSSGAAASASSHGASDHDVAELLRRIGALEERIAALEAGPDGSGGGLKKRSKRRRA